MSSTRENKQLDSDTQTAVNRWLEGNYDEETKQQIRTLLETDPSKVADAFYRNLEFGTGGLRGVMGVGTNRMNRYTVMAATQGLANYIKRHSTHTTPHVFIGYDSRHQSRAFAEESARVLAGNGIGVYLCKELRPTPLISFGCRENKCQAAIMITASHNPPEYNGYKVYWDDGGQVVAPHDRGIIEEVKKITDIETIQQSPLQDPLIQWVGTEIDEDYLAQMRPLQHYPEDNRSLGKNLHIAYANLHGTGITLIPKILEDWGFCNLSLVEAQAKPDGAFPTVQSPNPEDPQALLLGLKTMKDNDCDLLIATDPDADRMAVAVQHKGNPELLNGNQIACLCLEHVCRALRTQNRFPQNGAFVKTIVTTELFKVIAEAYGRPSFDVLTGFKYIAQQIHEWEQSPDGYRFLFGGEESYGYLLGHIVRDKDAVISSALIAEVALQAKIQNKTLIDLLYELYQKYGVYREKLASIQFGESKKDKESMDRQMTSLRETPPTTINGVEVSSIDDYLTSIRTDLHRNISSAIPLPSSNVLRFNLKDGSKVVVRPSGTEPKIKIYAGTSRPALSHLPQCISQCDNICDALINKTSALLKA